jgi:hypothetical protein
MPGAAVPGQADPVPARLTRRASAVLAIKWASSAFAFSGQRRHAGIHLALRHDSQPHARPVANRPRRPLAHCPPGTIGPVAGTDDFLLWHRVVPPLHHRTPRIDVVAVGQSTQVRGQAAAQLETQSAWLLKLLPDAPPNQRICLHAAIPTTDD